MCAQKKIGIPDKIEIRDKILNYCLDAVIDNKKFCRKLKYGGNLKWKNNKWSVKSTILHPIDIIIFYSKTKFIPKIKKPIHSEYSKCKIAANVLEVHYEWISGFVTGFLGINNNINSVFKRKTDIGQQARDGKDMGSYINNILLKEFIKVNEVNFDEHDWTNITESCVKCRLCEIIGYKKNNNFFVNSNLNCGAGCAKLII